MGTFFFVEGTVNGEKTVQGKGSRAYFVNSKSIGKPKRLTGELGADTEEDQYYDEK